MDRCTENRANIADDIAKRSFENISASEAGMPTQSVFASPWMADGRYCRSVMSRYIHSVTDIFK